MATYPIGLINRNRLIEGQTTGCARERDKNGSIPTIGQSLPVSHRRNTLKMSDINQIVTLHVKGKIVIEFSSTSPPPPSTPAASTGGSSSTLAMAPVDSSAPRLSTSVSGQELARQLDVMANVAREVHKFQDQQLIERCRLHEQFLARILNELEGLEDRADSVESRY